MIPKKAVRRMIDAILHPFGFRLMRESLLLGWQKNRGRIEYSYNKVKLPEGADDYLSQNNEKLVQLTRLYASLDTAVVTPSVWTSKHLRPIDLKYFRGDNPYVWQFKDYNSETAYVITAYYIKTIDTLNLLEKLKRMTNLGSILSRLVIK